MRFLADESCDGSVIAALRHAGHDVRSAAESLRGQPDDIVEEAAYADERVLMTEDRDFGHLVFAAVAVAALGISAKLDQFLNATAA